MNRTGYKIPGLPEAVAEISRPSAMPANVEAATVHGQATPREWWIHLLGVEARFGEIRMGLGEGTEIALISKLPARNSSYIHVREVNVLGSAVGTVAAPSDSPSPKSAAVAKLVEAAAQLLHSLECDPLLGFRHERECLRLRSALEVVKTDSAFSHNTESTKE